MAGGPAGFTRGYTCPALLRVPLCFAILRVPGYHRLRRDFPDTSPRLALAISRPSNPAGTGIPAVWAPPRSLAATGGITSCFLFLRVLRCFSSPRSPPPMMADGSPSDCRVAPFGNPRINGRLRLPAAFRSLPRPSSPSRATGIRRAPFLAFARPRMAGGACPGIPTPRPRQIGAGRGNPSLFSYLVFLCSIMSKTGPPERRARVENIGIEPMTSCMPCKRSSQLS